MVDSRPGAVELGHTPLVVPEFYGLSNAVNESVLKIQNRSELVCTIRLLTSDVSVPAQGRLVTEDDATQRKGRTL